MRKVPTKIEEMVIGVVEPLGYELWGIELLPRQKSGQLLRIYIDAEGGIDLSACEAVSRQMSAVLDVEDPIHGEYTLEVSSPGMDRPLFTESQFSRYVDNEVRVKLHSSVSGRKNYRGTMTAVSDGQVQLSVDGEVVTLPLDEIDTARVVPTFQMENKR
jgi:ribosome maturation factor RimP